MRCSTARWDRSSSMACAFATASHTACSRWPTFWPSRAMSVRSKSRCGWETSASTNTFAPSDSASAPASNFRAKLADLTKPVEPLVQSFDRRDFHGPGDWHLRRCSLASLISTMANDGVHVPPRIVAGTIAPQNTPTDHRVSAGRRNARHLASDGSPDAADASGSGSPRHRAQSASRGLQFGAERREQRRRWIPQRAPTRRQSTWHRLPDLPRSTIHRLRSS